MAAQGDDARAIALSEESVRLAIQVDDKLNIACGMEGLAGVVEVQGKYAWAARLWGVAEALRKSIDAPLPPVERPSYEQAVAEARTHLGAQTFTAAWAEGRSMMPEDALRSEENGEAC